MTTYVIIRRVTRPTRVGPTWFDEMCEAAKATKAMRYYNVALLDSYCRFERRATYFLHAEMAMRMYLSVRWATLD